MNDSETMWGGQTLPNNAVSTVPPPPQRQALQENPVRREMAEVHWREGLNRVKEKEPGRGTCPQLSGRQVCEVGTVTKPEGSESPEKRDVHFA